jgi:hypothetical protein
MNRTINTNSEPGDPLDVLLRSYFRSEMPRRWPASPQKRRLTPRHGGTDRLSVYSRLALAASVALLLIGGWLLSGRLAGPDVPSLGPMGPGAAKKGDPLLPQLPMK